MFEFLKNIYIEGSKIYLAIVNFFGPKKVTFGVRCYLKSIVILGY